MTEELAQQAGYVEFLTEMLGSRGWVNRVVESIEFVDQSFRQRRVSVDVNGAVVKALAFSHGIPDGASAYLPIAVLPKGIIHDFDVRDANDMVLSIANRRTDSVWAASVLAVIGGGRSTVPAPCSDYLFSVAHAMAGDAPEANGARPWELTAFMAWLGLPGPATVSSSLKDYYHPSEVGAAYKWWKSAIEVAAFRSALEFFTSHFMLLVNIRIGPDVLVIKYRRIEGDPVYDVAGKRPRIRKPGTPLAMRLHHLGRSSSDHANLTAPDGCFIHDVRVGSRSTPQEVVFRSSRAGTRIYAHSTPQEPVELGQDMRIMATVWPRPQGFYRPALVLMLYSAAVISGLFLYEAYQRAHGGLTIGNDYYGLLSIADALSGQVDAAVTLIAVVPSILVVLVVSRQDEHILRNKLLLRARRCLFSALGALWIAVAVLLFDLPSGVILGSWGLCAIAALACVVTVIREWRAVRAAEKLSEQSLNVLLHVKTI